MITQLTSHPHLAIPAERGGIVADLSDAFFGDRVFRWLEPDDTTRASMLPPLFGVIVDGFFPHGAVTVADGGAALWAPPEAELTFADDPALAGDRLERLLGLLAEHHPHEPHWYLGFLGVESTAQGRGIGSALLAATLRVVDAQRMPAYLEATCPENRRLYERHGFVCTRELVVDDCPPLYAMWRAPR